jgi:hypothetical protein
MCFTVRRSFQQRACHVARVESFAINPAKMCCATPSKGTRPYKKQITGLMPQRRHRISINRSEASEGNLAIDSQHYQINFFEYGEMMMRSLDYRRWFHLCGSSGPRREDNKTDRLTGQLSPDLMLGLTSKSQANVVSLRLRCRQHQFRAPVKLGQGSSGGEKKEEGK